MMGAHVEDGWNLRQKRWAVREVLLGSAPETQQLEGGARGSESSEEAANLTQDMNEHRTTGSSGVRLQAGRSSNCRIIPARRQMDPKTPYLVLR